MVWKELMPVILHTNQRIRIDWRKTGTKRTFGLEYECVSASACVHSLLLATYNGAEYKDIVLLPNITITSTAHQQNNKDETNETNERANWTSSNSRNVFEDVLLCVFFWRKILPNFFWNTIHIECTNVSKKRNTFPLNMWDEQKWNWWISIVAIQHSSAHHRPRTHSLRRKRKHNTDTDAANTQKESESEGVGEQHRKKNRITKMKMCTQHFQYANLFPFGCRCRWWWWCDMPIWKGHLNTLSSLFSLSFFLSFSRSSDCSKSSRKKNYKHTHVLLRLFRLLSSGSYSFSCSPVALSLCFIHSKMCVRFFCFRNKIVSCWWAICMHWLCYACVQARMHVWIEIISFTEKKTFNSRS